MSTLLTLPQTLEILGVSRSTFSQWRATGRAPRAAKLPNGQLRFRVADLEAWLELNTEGVLA